LKEFESNTLNKFKQFEEDKNRKLEEVDLKEATTERIAAPGRATVDNAGRAIQLKASASRERHLCPNEGTDGAKEIKN